MKWLIEDEGFRKENIEFFGSKYLLANGYMGYRGTLEEYGKEQLCACTLAGIYDKSGEGWREPVNMPNPFFVRTKIDGEAANVLEREPVSHRQWLDLYRGKFGRDTAFDTPSGRCSIHTERFLSRERLQLMALKYVIQGRPGAFVEAEICLNREIWDINGPHLEEFSLYEPERREGNGEPCVQIRESGESGEPCGLLWANSENGEPCGSVWGSGESGEQRGPLQEDSEISPGWNGSVRIATATTVEQRRKVAAGQLIVVETEGIYLEKGIVQGRIPENGEICFFIYGWMEKDAGRAAIPVIEKELEKAADAGYMALRAENEACWRKIWRDAEVIIEGDEKMEQALCYSMYQLISSAPFHTDETAIPARGLSGQVYKGAMFWDTELFMLPFFRSALPEAAKNLVRYRIRTLDGAKRKAASHGFAGAFYAWESQDTGEEACTKYSFTDVFTGRPLRTYFGDKQIHISADVAYGIWKYYEATGDKELLLTGGLETITECIRFLYDYSVFKDGRKRYELHDVIGPDEYHERDNNDAYTNLLTKEMAEIMFRLWEELGTEYPDAVTELKEKLFTPGEFERMKRFTALLYVPEPNKDGVIEQCDGYFALEDVAIDELLKRRLKDTEYLGGANGIASTTQVIKQADAVLATTLFPDRFNAQVRESNYRYYEPRTEHGSSLSACVYALGAIDCGDKEKAYEYLEKTACIDLEGKYKLYVGGLYIGGVHTAANGGAWLVAVQGFAGVDIAESGIHVEPCLPDGWKSVTLTVHWRGRKVRLKVEQDRVNGEAFSENTGEAVLYLFGEKKCLMPGTAVCVERQLISKES